MIYKSLQLSRLSFDSRQPKSWCRDKSFDIQKAGGRMIESKDDNSDLRRGFNTIKLWTQPECREQWVQRWNPQKSEMNLGFRNLACSERWYSGADRDEEHIEGSFPSWLGLKNHQYCSAISNVMMWTVACAFQSQKNCKHGSINRWTEDESQQYRIN